MGDVAYFFSPSPFNRLPIYVIPMAGTKTVTLTFVVRAGWKYEDRTIEGLAHFLEHMAFKGTLKRPTTAHISAEVDTMGGMMNAMTDPDLITYFIKAPSRFTNEVVDILADMILNSTVAQEEIELEKGTIVEELRMYKSEPSLRVTGFTWPRLLYGDQPAGWGGVGTEESIQSLGRDAFREYHQDLFVSTNSAVVLAGDVPNPAKAAEMISSVFQLLPDRAPMRVMTYTMDNQFEPALLVEEMAIDQTWVAMGVRAFSVHSPDRYILQVLNTILGGSMSSRLFIQVRERRGLAYAIRSQLDLQHDIGSLSVVAGLKREKVPEALEIIRDEFRKLTEDRVLYEELTKGKNIILGHLDMELEQSHNVALLAARQWGLRGQLADLAEVREKIQAVNAEDIERVAQSIFRNESLNLAVVGPHTQDEDKLRALLRL